VFKAQD